MQSFTNHYLSNQEHAAFVDAHLMGPNALRLTEELTSHFSIEKSMRILDLGCGNGLSTLLLVEEYAATVFAADLWISPTENYERFVSLGIDSKAIPISVDATQGLPFAHGYFDVLISVDAYHYFGDTTEMLPSLIPYVKKGGYIAIAIPGLKMSFDNNVPEEMQPWWDIPDVARTIRSLDWWSELWTNTEGIEIVQLGEMACCTQAWDEWLASSNPHAAEDVKMMAADAGNYFNFIQLIARVV